MNQQRVLAALDVELAAVAKSSVLWLRPDQSATLARELLLDSWRRVAVVVDGGGMAVGVLTALELLGLGELADARVQDVMNHHVFSLPSNAALSQAAALMAYERVGECVVIGPFGRAIGLVTAIDVAAWMGRAAGYMSLLGRPNRGPEPGPSFEPDDSDFLRVPQAVTP